MDRRKFIAAAGLSSISLSKLFARQDNILQDTLQKTSLDSIAIDKTEVINTVLAQKRIFPKALQKGSRIGIITPASPTSMSGIGESYRALKRLGLELEVGNLIKRPKNNYRYFAGSEEQRLDELNAYVLREDIDCIFFGRGGYGIMRLLDKIDFDIFKKYPKIYIGFSDLTPLLYMISQKTGLVTFHGPVASTTFNNFTKKSFIDTLWNGNEFKPVKIINPNAYNYNDAVVEGEMVGGNLSMISSTIGTDYEIDCKGKILMLEETSEQPHVIDRMLTHLALAGKFDECLGIVFGYFALMNTHRPFYPNRSYTVKEIIEQVVVPYGKPILAGMPFGHTKDKAIMPMGSKVEFDTKNKKLTLIEQPVSYF